MTHSDLLAAACQGNSEAIARLLNRSLQAQNIRARVQRRQDQLFIRLESAEPIDQAIVARILEGLQRLSVQGIHTVHIAAQTPETARLCWQTQVTLATSGADDNTTTSQPENWPAGAVARHPNDSVNVSQSAADDPSINDEPPRNLVVSHLAEMPQPLLLPEASFWFGWVALSILGITIGAIWQPSPSDFIERQYLLYFLKTIWGASCLGIGQWLVLRQEVTWARSWLPATVAGAIASGLLDGLRILLFRQWDWLTELLRFPVVLTLMVLVAAPLIVSQWLVLQRHLEMADLWLGAGIAWVAMRFLVLSKLLPTITIGAVAVNSKWLLAVISAILFGSIMLYLLRGSAISALKLNRFTDVGTRRRLLRQRRDVNARLFWEWTGWTLLSWALSGLISTVLTVFTLGLAGFFSFAILLMAGAGLQWIALRRRIVNSKQWFIVTASSAIALNFAGLVLGLVIGGATLQSMASSSSQYSGFRAYFALIGIGISFIYLFWLGVILAQSIVLKRRGYRLSWWIGAHAAMTVAVLFNQPWQELRYLLPGLLFWLVMMPGAVMVWILGYPRSLQPDFAQLMD